MLVMVAVMAVKLPQAVLVAVVLVAILVQAVAVHTAAHPLPLDQVAAAAVVAVVLQLHGGVAVAVAV